MELLPGGNFGGGSSRVFWNPETEVADNCRLA
jgi:hypothetical protein